MEQGMSSGLPALAQPVSASGDLAGSDGIPPVAVACADHLHAWRRLPDSMGLFTCTRGDCRWCALCPVCLGSLDMALRARDGMVGMALYWCPAHQGGGAHDG